MLRLTTKVAVSPASSARSSSAATRISSITSGRVSANSAVSSSSVRARPIASLLDRPRREAGVERLLAAAAGAAARDEAPVLELDHVEHALLHPLRVHVLRVDAEALGQREAARRELLADLVRARELRARARCGRRWRKARRGRWHPASTSSGHQSDRFGGTWTPTSGISRLHSAISRFMSSIDTGDAQSGSVGTRLAVAVPVAPALPRRLVGDLGDLAAVVARVRDEVLQDHLLEVAVAAVDLGERLERRDPLFLGLADPDQDSAGERDPQLAGGLDRLQPRAPGAWSASPRGRSPSAARRPTRASAPGTR